MAVGVLAFAYENIPKSHQLLLPFLSSNKRQPVVGRLVLLLYLKYQSTVVIIVTK